MANIVMAYIFWLVGGPLGLHHFYLGRDKQALVWWMSLGGFFLGWLRDLWRLPEYLYEANQDPRVKAIFRERRQRHAKPPWKLARFAGGMLIGTILAYLFRLAIPEFVLDDLDFKMAKLISVIFPILGASTGVYLVGNIGLQKVSMKWCMIGASISIPWLLLEQPAIVATALFAALFANYKTEWDIEKVPPSGCCNFMRRVLILTLFGTLYLSLWTSAIYFNMHVTTSDGMTVPVYEAMGNFFKSPAWKDFKKSMNQLYEECSRRGWDQCYYQLVEHLDPTGETHAYKVLELDRSATAEEIQQRCRKLSRQFHPDRFKTEEEKLDAQEKFIEIQKACDTLNEMRKRRTAKNMQSQSTTEKPFSDHTKTEF